ncbi:hypothetical protein FKP32DRAFT_644874 [Trametes sanguinea]|nr:hypothetical protein FKP32DRAFT_644874 [Trametes sanguinea]
MYVHDATNLLNLSHHPSIFPSRSHHPSPSARSPVLGGCCLSAIVLMDALALRFNPPSRHRCGVVYIAVAGSTFGQHSSAPLISFPFVQTDPCFPSWLRMSSHSIFSAASSVVYISSSRSRTVPSRCFLLISLFAAAYESHVLMCYLTMFACIPMSLNEYHVSRLTAISILCFAEIIRE